MKSVNSRSDWPSFGARRKRGNRKPWKPRKPHLENEDTIRACIRSIGTRKNRLKPGRDVESSPVGWWLSLRAVARSKILPLVPRKLASKNVVKNRESDKARV